MQGIRSYLPLWFMLPASVAVTLFFVIPVIMTFVFSFTTMSSDTGILGNRYVVSEATIRTLKGGGMDAALLQKLGSSVFVFDDRGLAALRNSALKPAVVKEIEEKLSGKVYATEKQLFAALRGLNNRPRSFKDRKAVSKSVVQTLKNREFFSEQGLRAGLTSIGVEVTDDVFDSLLDAANTSWKWTTGNYSELMASDFTVKILANTAFYVVLTLFFNVGLALLLALATFYMPSGQSKFFRAVWLIPRVSPSVIYIMLWRWLSYDNGFISYVLGFFGVEPENWLNEFPWTFVILANGFVGASMGMIIFASAVLAIPADVLHAAEVDG
ncbi:MAG: sugar ABC transporter permease, partial [Proteobacteria bacterium]|nr:sugar ABC transporter permease [Pseudomonadota bacterium]